MKESEIWREVGRRMETRTYGKGDSAFICYVFMRVYEELGLGSPITGYEIGNKRYCEFADHSTANIPIPYAYNDCYLLEENHEGRTLAAYWMALEAEAEGN